jgi:hypothetical protein
MRCGATIAAVTEATFAIAVARHRRELRRHCVRLVMRDVLRCSAGQTATAMSLTVPATNSALQRARTGLRAHLGPQRLDWASARPSTVEQPLLDGLMAACS